MEYIQIVVGVINMALLTVLMTINRRPLAGRQSKGTQSVILDSCALIDGRIIDLAKAGFTPSQMIVPAFIISELQLLADGADSHKRERARYGLDVVNELKSLDNVDVLIDRNSFDEHQKTDDKLLALAKKLHAPLYTTDFNLSKVAEVEDIVVLNVNELAQKLKNNVLPGERIFVSIVQKGSSKGQGVGYADDGTMVVVEQADRLIGTSIEVTVEKLHNTVAGKMIFAKPIKPKGPTGNRQGQPKKPKTQKAKTDDTFVTDLRRELSS